MFFNKPKYVQQVLVMDSPQWKRMVAELGKAYPNDFAKIMKIIAKHQTFVDAKRIK